MYEVLYKLHSQEYKNKSVTCNETPMKFVIIIINACTYVAT